MVCCIQYRNLFKQACVNINMPEEDKEHNVDTKENENICKPNTKINRTTTITANPITIKGRK